MKNKNPRLTGLFCIVCGALLSYIAVWLPYQDALHNADHVSLNFKAVLFAPTSLLYGMAMLLAPPQVSGNLAQPARSPLQILFGVIAIGLGIAFFFWYKSSLEGMGYHFNF